MADKDGRLLSRRLRLAVQNDSAIQIEFELSGQHLTSSAAELLTISNSPTTNLTFLKGVAEQIVASLKDKHKTEVDLGTIRVQVAALEKVGLK